MKNLLIINECDIDVAFGVTGSGDSWSLISDLVDQGIPYYPVVHESVAAIMAGAVSLKGKMGASISIKGPGLTNMIPGIANNFFENRPSISISECHLSSSNSAHKRLDHEAILRPIVKQVSCNPNGLTDLAKSEPCGPVHLDLSNVNYRTSENKPPMFESPQSVGKALNPILIVGGACRRSKMVFSDLNIPVFTTATAKGVIDESLSHAAGVFTGVGLELSAESLIEKSDMVIGVNIYDHEWLSKPDVFNISIKSYEQIRDYFVEKNWGQDEITQYQSKLKNYESEKWLPYQCFNVLNGVEWDYDLVCDVGLFSVVAEHCWISSPSREFFGSLNSRYMGTSVPTAAGLCIAGRKPTVCVVGDGGSGMYLSDYRTIQQENLPICILIMSDGRFGSIASSSSRKYQKATYAAPPSSDVVEGMGIPFEKVRNDCDLRICLHNWDRESPMVLACDFDPDIYQSMTKELRK